MIITKARRFIDEEEEQKELLNNDIQDENKKFNINNKSNEGEVDSTCC